MRGKLQVFYDNFYYRFERWYNFHTLRLQTWRKYLGVKFGQEFYDAYHNDIAPYWAQYGVKAKVYMVKYIYSLSHDLDHRYVPNDIWNRYVVPHFNDQRFSRLLADKNLNSVLLPDIKRPRTLFKAMSGGFCLDDFTPISREQALRLCATPGRWLVKPTLNSFGGLDVRFFDGTGDAAAMAELLGRYRGTDYIVQQAIVQHPDMAALNATSVNTLRVVSLVFQQQVYILSRILRVGAPGSVVDNVGAGGRQFNVLPDGTVDFAVCNVRTPPPGLPDFRQDARFAGFAVPSFDKARDAVLAMAKKLPHLHLVAWDLAIDEAGDVVLLEFNTFSPGQNHSTSGPAFGDMTDQVLAEVFGKKK